MTKISMIPFLQENIGYSWKVWQKITEMSMVVYPGVILGEFFFINTYVSYVWVKGNQTQAKTIVFIFTTIMTK